jgi:hypothetical protein
MKASAFILLICFTAYLTETIRIPISFSANCSKTTGCSKMIKEPCTKKNNSDKKDQKNNPGNCNTICANCPLNSVTLLPHKSVFNQSSFHKKEFPEFTGFTLQGYIPDAWKPPNNF